LSLAKCGHPDFDAKSGIGWLGELFDGIFSWQDILNKFAAVEWQAYS
jgi:hypothetical protein